DDQNRFGPSGIEQSEEAHNLVRLAIDGTTQHQRAGRSGQIVALGDEPSYAYVASDTASLYDAGVASLVRREFVFLKPNTFVVYDRVVTPAGTTKSFQLNTGILPTVNDALATIANSTSSLTLQRILPTGAPISIISGDALGLEENGPHTGYRLDIPS